MIVSAETGGLGNRLKCWVSARRLDPDARVYWPTTANMPARFPELFANDCSIECVPEDARVRASWRLEVLPEDEEYLPRGFATAGGVTHPMRRAIGKAWWTMRGRPDDRYRYMLFPKQHARASSRADGRHIDLEYERIPAPLRETYAACFRRIEIQPAIAEAASRWAEQHIDPRVIGLQIRTWRDSPRRQRKYHRPAAARLSRLIDGAGAGERFLVVSDSDEAVDRLRARCGGERVLVAPRTTRRAESWRSSQGIADDLLEMLLLARTERMFLSYLSTFGEAAWWLGGARAAVTVF